MTDETEFDPNARRLCPDGSCIGLIGPDGRCTQCGRASGSASDSIASTQGGKLALDDSPVAGASPASTDSGEGFNSGRRLCDDGTCLGVVGDDGRCSVCRRAAGP